MEKDKIFFGESGLTTTSANHVANLAKEAVETLETSLIAVRFYDTTVGLLGSTETKMISKGMSSASLYNIKPILKDIAQHKSLIAWLREAIKAKARLISEAEHLSDKEVADMLEIEFPNIPEKKEYTTDDEFISQWSIKKRNRYYYLDTVCAVIGKYIHPNGKFAVERQSLKEVINDPNELKGSGRDAVVWTKTPTVLQEQVDECFFDLQKEYREYQAELNSMKHEIEMLIEENQRKIDAEYAKACNDYRDEMKPINAKIVEKRKQEVAKAQNLKIVIPDSLKDIFKKVSA